MRSADRDTTPQNHSCSDRDRQAREGDAMRAGRQREHVAASSVAPCPQRGRTGSSEPTSACATAGTREEAVRCAMRYNMCDTWRPQAPCREKGKLAREEGTWLLWLSWCLPNIGENEQELWMINQGPRTHGRRIQAQPATPSPVTATTEPDHFSLLSSQYLICAMQHWHKSANTLKQLHPFAGSYYSVMKTRTFLKQYILHLEATINKLNLPSTYVRPTTRSLHQYNRAE